MILHNQDLVDELRDAFNKAQYRIWIAVPFIGSWRDVERITGNSWITNKNIEKCLITDIRNEHFIDYETFSVFSKCFEMKTLAGLHAKLYIIDDFMLLTSANLTGAAFAKRYEIGIKLKGDQVISDIFNEWWTDAKKIDEKWKPKILPRKRNREIEDSDTSGLNRLWKLPKNQGGQVSFKEYAEVVNSYNYFAREYEKHIERVIPKLPLYQEIDAFFNYLYHEHPTKPSNPFMKKVNRKLNPVQFTNELKLYASQFKKWIGNNSKTEMYRMDNIKVIQGILSPGNIKKIKIKEIKSVVDCMHCMNSLPINKYKFLNEINNNYKVIRQQWENLLHNKSIGLDERMAICHQNLKYFNKSSMRELIGWYYPQEYPIVNSNSNCGMKFFGYDIKTY